jgi:hypothetical protein
LEDLKVLLSNNHLSDPRLLDKSRALYRRARKRDLSLPPLLPAPGMVYVTLPTPRGFAMIHAARGGGWRFRLIDVVTVPAPAPAPVPPVRINDLAAELRRWRQIIDERLDELVDLDGKLRALEAKHRVNTNTAIAAE